MKKLYILFLIYSVNLFSQKNNSGTVLGINYGTDQLSNLKTDPNFSVLNGTNTIQTHFTVTACGLDFVATSVRLCKRGGAPAGVNQPATFAVTGLPTCFLIEKAFFYTGGSGSGPTINLSFTNPVSTNSVFAMVNSGYSGTDKWGGYGGTWTRRADVTALITGNGNYVVSGIPTGSPNDPDGGTLVIVYSDMTQTFTGSMILADGTMATGGPGNLNSVITGFNVCANSTLDKHFIIAGDLQSLGPYNMRFNNAGNNYVYPTPQQFYDYVPFSGSAVTAGQTTANYGLNNATGDAFALYAVGLYYRTACNVCAGGPCILPIELRLFDAKCDNEKVNVNWQTETELNNSHFTVLRSANGMDYEPIGKVVGSGTSTKTKQYSFIDISPLKGTSYYSLKQTDFNGKNEIFKAVTVSCNRITEFEIHPNPSKGLFSINDAEQNSEIIIIDVFGKVIFESKIITDKTEIDLSNQSNGIYFVKILSEKGITTTKIVVDK